MYFVPHISLGKDKKFHINIFLGFFKLAEQFLKNFLAGGKIQRMRAAVKRIARFVGEVFRLTCVENIVVP